MNLNGIVAPIVAAVTPQSLCTLQMSTGVSGYSSSGIPTPTYKTFTNVLCSIQSLTFQDLQKLDGLNIQGIKRKIYINGKYEAINRPAGKGGDLITFPDGTLWLNAQVIEYWPDWVSIAAVLQLSNS